MRLLSVNSWSMCDRKWVRTGERHDVKTELGTVVKQ